MSKIQNVAFVGHGTCGKTTLVEELLFRGKSLPRAGKVDDKTSVLDSTPQERERHFTIEASVGSVTKGGDRINLVDTPGYPDFLSTAVDAMSAVETAVIVVDGTQGIRVNTRRVWDEANKLHLARMIVVSRLDMEMADFEARVSEIQETFGSSCVPLFLPNASGRDFASIDSAYPLRDDSSDSAKSINSQIVEAVIEADEDLMERYLADEKISEAEIDAVFTQALLSGTIVPIIPVSVMKEVGVDELLETLWHLLPDADVPHGLPMHDAEGNEIEESPCGSADDPLLARVWKVDLDPFVGKLSYLRIYAGTASPNQQVTHHTKSSKDRLTNLLRTQGKEQETIDSAGPGDIIAVPKVESLSIGDTIGDASLTRKFATFERPRSMVKLAVEAKNRNDETKLNEVLIKLTESDSAFSVERVVQTHELVISGRSQLHLDIMLSR
ncbi:MAG: GTP-binding protein, partial [Planctomycetota bacterium]